jgi:hypothetical protein
MKVIHLTQAQQMKSGKASSWSTADDANTAVIFQPQICQIALLRKEECGGLELI